MWRAAKRAAYAAVSASGRGATAGGSSSSARSAAADASGAARRAADAPGSRRHQQRRRSVAAEGLVQLRQLWELEAAAAARRRANGDTTAAAIAADMIRALRRSGASWFDAVSHPIVIREASAALADARLWLAPATAAKAIQRPFAATATQMRRVVPTLALRHAGGSWADVLSHPAFRLRLAATPKGSGPGSGAAAAPGFPFSSARRAGARDATLPPPVPFVARAGTDAIAASSGAVAARVRGGRTVGPSFPKLREELTEFISSSAALRHAGCSWLDVARHAAFHACVRARIVGGGYSVYLATFVRHPFTTALVTSVTKCVASDLAVQKFVERREEVDFRRVGCFFVLGLTYVGAFQYGLYNRLMKPLGDALTTRWGTGAGVGAMVAVDQFIVCPLVYLPSFYALKAMADGECSAAEAPAHVARKLLGGGGEDGGGWLTLVALWAYWMPAQAVNFWAVPRHLTIPFMNVAGFGWNAIMSAMNGAPASAAAARADADASRDAVRRKTSAARSAAVEAATPRAEALAEPESARAAEECLADDACVKALALATGDALAVAVAAAAGPGGAGPGRGGAGLGTRRDLATAA